MAEKAGVERGSAKKSGVSAENPFEEFIWFFLLVVVFGGIISQVVLWLRGNFEISSLLGNVVSWIVSVGKFISTIISLLLLTAITYSVIRLTQLNREFNARYKEAEKMPTQVGGAVAPLNQKWQRVLVHLDSENPNDWRLAVLEADIMLDEMLQKMGYRGDSVGDKLKNIEESDFTSINEAWEAHKVRNQIAHQGSDFLITEREARRIVDLYKRAFEEFRYI